MRGLLVAVFLAFWLSAFAPAQILLKPSGGSFQPLVTKSVTASTKIDRGLAATTLTLVFSNPSRSRIEADFVYTVRPGTLVTGFAYWYEDEKVVARVVEKERALDIYDAITRPGKDPALVEMIGKRTFRARIFPIQPLADLKVEMTLVQPLEQGQTYVLPLEMPKGEKLEKLDVRIEVAPDPSVLRVQTSVPMKAAGDVYTLQAENYRPQADLRLTLVREPQALRAALYAARSGGTEGYFTLTLTPSRAWQVERLEIRGVRTSGVRFPKAFTANETALVTGKYTGTGPAELVFKPKGAAAIVVPLVFESRAEQNHPGMKLWAAEEIERLGEAEGVRNQVSALSTRHTIPSKFTSWLAIPAAEQKNFAEQIKRSRATQVARLLGREIAAGREKSARAKQLDAQLNGLVKELKLGKKELLGDVLRDHSYQLAATLAEEIVAGQEKAARAKAQLAELTRLSKWTGANPKALVEDQLSQWSWEQANRIANEILADRAEGPVAKALRAESQRLAKWTGGEAERIDSVLDGRLRSLASDAATEMLAGKPERGAAIRKEMLRLAGSMRRKDALKLPDQWIDGAISESLGNKAQRVAQILIDGGIAETLDRDLQDTAKRLGKSRDRYVQSAMANHLRGFLSKQAEDSRNLFQLPSLGAEETRRLELLAKLPSGSLDTWLRWDLASRQYEMAARELVRAVEEGQGSSDYTRRVRTLAESLSSSQPEPGRFNELLAGKRENRAYQVVYEYAEAVAKAGPNSERASELRTRYDRLRTPGLPRDLLRESLLGAIWNWNGRLSYGQDETLRNFEAIAEAERAIDWLVEAAGAEGKKALARARTEGIDPETQARRRLLELLRAGSPDRQAIQEAEQALSSAQVWKDERWHKARMERLAVEVTLERLERQPRTAEIERQVAELRQRQQELRARMGDPLVTSDAPEDARLVVARMPDGEIKRLEWNPLTKRWEARFDIPAHAAEGEYTIEIIAVLANGERRVTTMTYHVDNTSPTGVLALTVRERRLLIEVSCSADTARVEAVLPWGDLVSLERAAEGRFFGVVEVPPSADALLRVRVVLTDKAHNRGEAQAEIKGR